MDKQPARRSVRLPKRFAEQEALVVPSASTTRGKAKSKGGSTKRPTPAKAPSADGPETLTKTSMSELKNSLISDKRKGTEKDTASVIESNSPTAEDNTDISTDLTSDEDIPPQKSLVCVLWTAKAGQRKPLGAYCLETVNLWSMTYPDFIAHFDSLVISKCGAKETTNATIRYSVKACKMAAKATDLPKGFPNCIDFTTCDCADAYDSFLELVRLNIAQMKTGTQPVLQVVGCISAAAMEGQDIVTTGLAECVLDDDNDATESQARKVFLLSEYELIQTVTHSQIDEMRACVKASDHPYVQAQNSIRDKWRCTKCASNTFCFILKHPDSFKPDVHVELTPRFIDIWASEVKAGRATVSQPPRYIEEIDKGCNAALLRPQTRGRQAESSAARTQNQGYAPVINYNIQPPPLSDMRNTSPRPRTPPPGHCYDALSPISGYAPKDYTQDAMKDFMTHLGEKYEDPRFVDVLGRLRENDIGVDLLSGPNMARTISDLCEISSGMAMRMVRDYPGWKRSLKEVHLIKT